MRVYDSVTTTNTFLSVYPDIALWFNCLISFPFLVFSEFCSFTTANKTLEEKLQEMNSDTDKTVAELKERIQGLEKELDNANDLLSSSKFRGQLIVVWLLSLQPWFM